MTLNKKLIVITLILLSLFMIGTVSAASDTETNVNSDITHKEKVSHTDTTTNINSNSESVVEKKSTITNTTMKKSGTLKKSVSTNKKEYENKDNKLSSTNNNNLLRETDDGTFTTLQTKINNAPENSIIELNNSYTYNDGFNTDGIKIEGKTITIHGNGYTIDGAKTARIFNVTGNANLTLENLNIINGNGNKTSNGNRGGAIYAQDNATITITNSNFTQNKVTSWYQCFGGAIYAQDNTNIIITQTNFNNNTAQMSGGAIYAKDNATITITNSNFTQNNASNGGAILAYNNTNITITQTNFNNNTAISYDTTNSFGGAINIRNSKLNISNSNFTQNTAKVEGEGITSNVYGHGGAISIDETNVTITQTNFNNNSAEGGNETDGAMGGAIHVISYEGAVIITESNFTENNANYSCGAIFVNKMNVEVINSTFKNNNARVFGAMQRGIAIFCIFENNNCSQGTRFPLLEVDDKFTSIYQSGDKILFNVSCLIDYLHVTNYYDGVLTNITVYKDGSVILRDTAKTGSAYGWTIPNNLEPGKYSVVLSYDKYPEIGNKTVVLTLNKAEKNTEFADLDVPEKLYQGKNATINGTLLSDGTGLANQEIIISVTNAIGYENNYTANTDNDGKFSQIIKETILGNINIKVIYKGNDTSTIIYKPVNATMNSEVIAVTYTITLNPLDSYYYDYNSTVTISGLVDSNYEPLDVNKINITINGGQIIPVEVSSDRMFTYTIKDIIIPGEYIVVANCSGYTNTTSFFIKYPTEFTIITSNSTTNQPITINITENNGFTGKIILKINEDDYEITLTNGKGNSDPITLPLGKYTATIDYEGNDTYNATKATSQEFYIKYPTEFTIGNIDNFTQGSSIQLIVSEKNYYTGIVTVSIGSENYTVTLNEGNGKSTITPKLKPGTYIASINFPGNKEYTNATANSNKFTIKYPTKFTIQKIPNTTTDKTITLTITESNGFTGTVNIKIAKKEYNIQLNNGKGNKNIKINTPGNYIASINFPGNKEYANTTTNSNQFNIKYPTKFTIQKISDTTTNKAINITVTEANGFTGTVNVKIGNKDYKVQLQNGKGKQNIKINTPGTYTASIKFPGNKEYANTTTNSNQFTIKYPTKFTIQKIPNTTTDKTITLTITESNGFTGTVNIKIGNKDYKVQLQNGKGKQNIKINTPGTYTASIKFPGNNKYTNTTTNSNKFTIKYPTKFTIQKIPNTTTDKTITLTITESNGFTGTVNIKIGNKDYKVQLQNGKGKQNIKINTPGTYTASIKFPGNKEYINSNKFTIKYPTKFTINKIPNVTQGSKIKLTIQEKNKYTGPVNVTIGSETYLVKLNKGIGKKTVTPKVTPKTYVAKIQFSGDEKYSPTNSVSNKFQVNKKPDVKLNVVIVAVKKTFYTEDAKKYNVILKDIKGKIVKNAQITLKVKGETYNVNTNNKGIATFKLTNLNKKGTYKAITKFEGNKNYNKASNKTKITIKDKGNKDQYDVKKIQRALKKNGYYRYACHRYLLIDGLYLKWTTRAVKQFQKAKKLKVTGKVDYTTAKKLGII